MGKKILQIIGLPVLVLITLILSLPMQSCTAPAEPSAPSAQVTTAATSAITGNFGLKPLSTEAGIQIVPVDIPVSDGKKLAADIYIPEKGGPFPVILIQTPYNKVLYRTTMPQELTGQRPATTSTANTFGGAGGSFIQSTDYVIVAVDWRGRFGSSGAGGILGGVGTPEQRRQDGYDTVEWIAVQPWCNGKVGMWGSSALGTAQYATASKQPPHLVCMMPRVSDYANSYASYYFGGVVRKEYMDGLTAASWGALVNILMAHPTDDGFYDGKDTADPKYFKTPSLLIGGWWDIHDTPSIYNSILAKADSAAANNFRMMICPTTHTNIARDDQEGELEFPDSGQYARNEQKKYFDYWLRGVDGSYDSSAPVTYYQMGINKWLTATQWPPAGMKKTNYFLNDSGTLSTAPAAASVAPRPFKFDPKSPVPTDGGNIFQPGLAKGPVDQSKIVERHKDALIFTSEILGEDVAIAGEISATLYVSSDAVDTDVNIRVTDVYPDGRSMLVRDGVQRLSHMESDKAEKFIAPGTIYPVIVKTYSVGQTFIKGHCIRLIVSASNYPRYGVNNGSQDRNKAPVNIVDTLYLDASHPSTLVLPVVPR
jgi:uncharacterized protein